jgi:hypothetical protein
VVIAAVPHVDVGKVRIDAYEDCTYADLPDVPPEKYSTGRQDDDPGGWPQTGQNQGGGGTSGDDGGVRTCTVEGCQPPPQDAPTDPPAEPKKALKAAKPYPFKDPCFTGYWGRFWDSVDWQNDKVLGEVGHAAEMAEMVIPVAVLTTIGAYAESARRYGGSLLPMAPGGFLGGPWLGSGGGLARAAKFARTPAGVVGVGIGVGVFSAAAVDAYRSGCH